jgi:hypothetical protein
MRRAPDWLTAWDDFLCERSKHCLRCTRWTEKPWIEILTLASGVGYYAVQCTRCYKGDPTYTAVKALLEQRYRAQGDLWPT